MQCKSQNSVFWDSGLIKRILRIDFCNWAVGEVCSALHHCMQRCIEMIRSSNRAAATEFLQLSQSGRFSRRDCSQSTNWLASHSALHFCFQSQGKEYSQKVNIKDTPVAVMQYGLKLKQEAGVLDRWWLICLLQLKLGELSDMIDYWHQLQTTRQPKWHLRRRFVLVESIFLQGSSLHPVLTDLECQVMGFLASPLVRWLNSLLPAMGELTWQTLAQVWYTTHHLQDPYKVSLES